MSIEVPRREPDYVYESRQGRRGLYWFEELVKQELITDRPFACKICIIEDEVYRVPSDHDPDPGHYVIKHDMYPQVEPVNDAYRDWLRSQTEKFLLGGKL